jgi:hypothetical protein
VYDVYSAGVNKGVYGPSTAAWVAAAAVVLLWRHAVLPMTVLLGRLGAGHGGLPSAAGGGGAAAAGYGSDRSAWSEEEGEGEDGGDEGEAWHAHQAGAGAAGPAAEEGEEQERAGLLRSEASSAAAEESPLGGRRVGARSSHRRAHAASAGGGRGAQLLRRAVDAAADFDFCDEVVDVGVCLTAAWANHLVDDEGRAPGVLGASFKPAVTALAAAVLAAHLLLAPLLPRLCRREPRDAAFARVVLLVFTDVALLAALATLSGVGGAVGAAALQGVLVLYQGWAAWYRHTRGGRS